MPTAVRHPFPLSEPAKQAREVLAARAERWIAAPYDTGPYTQETNSILTVHAGFICIPSSASGGLALRWSGIPTADDALGFRKVLEVPESR